MNSLPIDLLPDLLLQVGFIEDNEQKYSSGCKVRRKFYCDIYPNKEKVVFLFNDRVEFRVCYDIGHDSKWGRETTIGCLEIPPGPISIHFLEDFIKLKGISLARKYGDKHVQRELKSGY